MKYLIVGLGNIGAEYEDTRHNIGFKVVDAFAKEASTTFSIQRYASVAETKIKSHPILLIKPSTYMNLSGKAVNYWMQQEKIPIENVLVIVDDIALPFGSLRMKGKGSDAGHNGLKNIQEVLGHNAYPRLRFGLGDNYPRGRQIDYVLGQWSREETLALPERIDTCIKIITSFASIGLARTMSDYNNK